MATPVGHALAGYAVYSFSAASQERKCTQLALLSIFMAVAPDLDFLPGLLIGSPVLYHQGVSHSLGLAVVVSLGTAGVYRFKGSVFSATFTVCFISYLSHLLIDVFGPDGRWPYGVPLFWPLSAEYFISPVSVFWGAHHARSTNAPTLEWLRGIISLHNLGAIVIELVYMIPFVLLGKRYTRSIRDQQGSS